MTTIPDKLVEALALIEVPLHRLIDDLPPNLPSVEYYENALACIAQARVEIRAAVNASRQNPKPVSWGGADGPQRNTSPWPSHE